jgi:hypothetical protein
MKKKIRDERDDLEECRDKINKLLKEYNCELISADEWHHVLIRDCDTDETMGELR